MSGLQSEFLNKLFVKLYFEEIGWFIVSWAYECRAEVSNIEPKSQNWPNKGSNPMVHQMNFEFVFQIKIILWTVSEFKDLEKELCYATRGKIEQ